MTPIGKASEIILERRNDMSGLNTGKNKHMSLDNRLEIQSGLDHDMSFKAIARRIGKDPTTISKEVKKHLVVRPPPVSKTSLEGVPVEDKPCPSLIKAPFVCNPCKRRSSHCAYKKQFYSAKAAHKEYESLLSDAREGIPLNKEEFYEIDKIITTGIKNGQHLYHIMESNNIGISKSTAYRHLNRGYFSVSRLDLPRAVKFKLRKKKRVDYIPKAAKIGRTYNDFLVYKEERDISSWVEMDTVIGRIGGKAIMTFDFTLWNFMFGLLINDKTSAETAEKVCTLKMKLHSNNIRFGDVIPLMVTDNGGEFADIFAFINDVEGNVETDLFFCDPYRSSQKPKVEKTHSVFRDIVPKGTSFDNYTQETVDIIFSHVNSIKRKILYGKSPYDMFSFAIGENIAQLLGIKQIPACDVIQSPKLLSSIRHTLTVP